MKFSKSISGSCRSGELYSFLKIWDLENNWCYPKYTKSPHSLLASRVCSSNTSHLCITWFWALVLCYWSLASCHSTLHCCYHSVLLPMTLPLPLQPLYCSSLSICCICVAHSTAIVDLLHCNFNCWEKQLKLLPNIWQTSLMGCILITEAP